MVLDEFFGGFQQYASFGPECDDANGDVLICPALSSIVKQFYQNNNIFQNKINKYQLSDFVQIT